MSKQVLAFSCKNITNYITQKSEFLIQIIHPPLSDLYLNMPV